LAPAFGPAYMSRAVRSSGPSLSLRVLTRCVLSKNTFAAKPRLSVKLLLCLAAFCVVNFGAPVSLKAQDEDTTRRLWDTAFIGSGTKKPAPRKTTKRNYRVVTPNVP